MEFSDRFFEILKSSKGAESLAGSVKLQSDVEIYINTGLGLTPIPKVSEVHVEHGLWSIRTSKGDVSYYPSERIAGIKINDSEKRTNEGDRGTGFMR